MSDSSVTTPMKRVMTVGLCCMDIIHVCDTAPDEDRSTEATNSLWRRGGSASIMATVLRQFDVVCEFFGVVSDKYHFTFLLDDCTKEGIFTENCPTVAQAPPISTVLYARDKKTITIVHSNVRFPNYTFDHFMGIPNLAIYGWIHFEARYLDDTIRMMQHLKAWNRTYKETITVSLYLLKMDKELLNLVPWADYVFISKQFAQFMGWTSMRKASVQLKSKLIALSNLERFKLPMLICYWGLEGASFLTAEDDYEEFKHGPVTNALDPYGADDTFCASVIFALYCRRCELKKAVDFGLQVAQYKSQQMGFSGIEACRDKVLQSPSREEKFNIPKNSSIGK